MGREGRGGFGEHLQHVSVSQQPEPSNKENGAQPESVRGPLRVSRVLAVSGARPV